MISLFTNLNRGIDAWKRHSLVMGQEADGHRVLPHVVWPFWLCVSLHMAPGVVVEDRWLFVQREERSGGDRFIAERVRRHATKGERTPLTQCATLPSAFDSASAKASVPCR